MNMIFYNSRLFKLLPSFVTSIMLFGIVLLRGDEDSISRYRLNYLKILSAQYLEFMVLGLVFNILFNIGLLNAILLYYIVYALELVVRLLARMANPDAILKTSFTIEAECNMYEDDYLTKRHSFSSLRYLI